MNNTELKPCPFCGSDAKVLHYEDLTIDFASMYKHYVICLKCKANTDLKASVEDAIEAWNRRV